MFGRLFADRNAPRTIVVVPSLSLDPGQLRKIAGSIHYEERMLCLLMLLQMPRTEVVYVTSRSIHPAIIDYYLRLLPGVPGGHAARRLTLLDCDDGSPVPLTRKVLDRPRVLARMREAIADPQWAHVTCFNGTPLERTLAVSLGIPLYACDPDLVALGNKSNGRRMFRDLDIPIPDGEEHLRDESDVTAALAALRRRDASLGGAVVKLNESFSGEGNAMFEFDGAPQCGLESWVKGRLATSMRFEGAGESWEPFMEKLAVTGGVVEALVTGDDRRSPSVQCRVDPLGRTDVISTHDQVLGGTLGQVFLGASFPADAAYRVAVARHARRIAERLAGLGVLGRMAIDFVSVPDGDSWRHYALEVNLRKGGTTLPFLMLQFLTGGRYDEAVGHYASAAGKRLCYRASDNVVKPEYRGLTPDDLIDLAVENGLHFSASDQQGVVFHLLGALSQHGKLGMVCIAGTPTGAAALFDDTVAALDRAVGLAPR
jgi:hypothetical protein